MAADSFKVLRIETLDLPERQKALALLQETAEWVQPIMRKRSWSVPLLAESNFRTAGIQGMNFNAGEKILLRLRQVAGGAFYWIEHVVHTMLHELCHIVHSSHSAAFYQLYDELCAEWDANRAKNVRGTGSGFDARGFKADTHAHNPASIGEARRKAAASAEARLRRQALSGGGVPVAVGGQAIVAADEREAVRLATLRRCADWCGCDHSDEPEPTPSLPPLPPLPPPPVKRLRVDIEQSVTVTRADGGGDVDAVSRTHWTCVHCTLRNASDSVLCDACGGVRDGWWMCPQCTYANSSLFKCTECDCARAL